MKLFGREPAQVVGLLNALIMLAGTLGFALLTDQHAAAWVAVVNGASAALLAWTTRPLSPGVFSQLFATIVALIAGYGIELSPQFVFAANAAIVPILTFLTRSQVSPVETAVTKASKEPTLAAAKYEAEKHGVGIDEPVLEEGAGG